MRLRGDERVSALAPVVESDDDDGVVPVDPGDDPAVVPADLADLGDDPAVDSADD
jgi:hypothetical protein